MASETTSLHKVHALGQSIWYDNLRRSLLRSGALADLVARGVRGLTSNPTIFERAIAATADYEDALRRLVAEGRSTDAIYEDLAVEDIRGACDLMLPIFKESGGVDGRVSLEVPPDLAAVTDRTVAEGLRLAELVARPEPDDQGAGDAGGDPGDSEADRPRDQRERHPHLLARSSTRR